MLGLPRLNSWASEYKTSTNEVNPVILWLLPKVGMPQNMHLDIKLTRISHLVDSCSLYKRSFRRLYGPSSSAGEGRFWCGACNLLSCRYCTRSRQMTHSLLAEQVNECWLWFSNISWMNDGFELHISMRTMNCQHDYELERQGWPEDCGAKIGESPHLSKNTCCLWRISLNYFLQDW